jgi:hypothetical protein
LFRWLESRSNIATPDTQRSAVCKTEAISISAKTTKSAIEKFGLTAAELKDGEHDGR